MPILVVFLTFGIAFTVIGGNIAIDPTIVGYAHVDTAYCLPSVDVVRQNRFSAAYLIVIASFFYLTMKKGKMVRWFFWLYDQFPRFHRNAWEERMVNLMRRLRRQPVCILAKTDEVRTSYTLYEGLFILRK